MVAIPARRTSAVRYDWKENEVQSIYQAPLPERVYRAQSPHHEFHPPDRRSTLESHAV